MQLNVFKELMASVHEALAHARAQGRTATRWPATPTVSGRDAEAVWHEIEHGTPDTPQRVERIRRADALFDRHK